MVKTRYAIKEGASITLELVDKGHNMRMYST